MRFFVRIIALFNLLNQLFLDGSAEFSKVKHRRSTSPMSDEMRNEYLNKHNECRRNEHASDMELMVYNRYLEETAQMWADKCLFDHGMADGIDYSRLNYSTIGQNLYYTTWSASVPSVDMVMNAWYTVEKKDFIWDTGLCNTDRQCGHYRQITWAETRELGCTYKLCKELKLYTGEVRFNSYLVVCHYGPPGITGRIFPHQKGKACTACTSGSGWCDNSLCTSQCRGPGSNCQCSLSSCDNCGELNESSCRCDCPNGWYGNDCKTQCRDLNSFCNVIPGWPPYLCLEPEKYPDVYDQCPLMCGRCKAADAGFVCPEAPTTARGPELLASSAGFTLAAKRESTSSNSSASSTATAVLLEITTTSGVTSMFGCDKTVIVISFILLPMLPHM